MTAQRNMLAVFVDKLGLMGPILIVAIPGWLYLVGFWVRHKLLLQFGLTGSAVNPTFQEVAAYGVPPAILTAIASLVTLALSEKIHGKNSGLGRLMLAFIYLAMLPGIWSQVYAWMLHSTVASRLENKNYRYVYLTEKRCVVGVVIMQDQGKLLIFNGRGTSIIKGDDLISVLPENGLVSRERCRLIGAK